MLQCHPKANPSYAIGVLYSRRGKYKQALGVLRQAYDKPDGRLDPIISFYLAQTPDSRQHQGRFWHGENALDFAYSAPRLSESGRSWMNYPVNTDPLR